MRVHNQQKHRETGINVPTASNVNPANSQESQNDVSKVTRRRAGLSIRSRTFACNDIPGYRLYWFNDVPGRIASALASGYEYVTPEEAGISCVSISGSGKVGETDDLGSRVRVFTKGKGQDGGAIYAYLLKIREEWFQEDQELLEQNNLKVDNALRGGSVQNAFEFARGELKHNYKDSR